MDIPVADLERATSFYSHLLNLKITIEELDGMKFGSCPHQDNEAAFCLVAEPNFKAYSPDQTYPLIYLNVNGRMDDALEEVIKHGEKILNNKEQISSYGFSPMVPSSMKSFLEAEKPLIAWNK